MKAQEVFEAQLNHTAKMIRDHNGHYTDDGIDYLMGALDLSYQMATAYSDGSNAFERWLRERAAESQEIRLADPEGGWLLDNFASDGVAPEVYEYFGES